MGVQWTDSEGTHPLNHWNIEVKKPGMARRRCALVLTVMSQAVAAMMLIPLLGVGGRPGMVTHP